MQYIDFFTICMGLVFASMLFYSVIHQWVSVKMTIRISLMIFFLLLCIITSIHAYKRSIVNAHIQEFESAFKNNEVLICNYNEEQTQINKANFIYFSDLLTFSGKNDLKGINIHIEDCIRHIQAQDLEMIQD
ncbi:hypothetical protein CQA53_08290 [Helicobacter didelphidarum]|uniref:Uncharacterized protein n=1 Tax=Helicobacter didelphidarum TaxID=2040648 RepID=A0A3D8IEG9_9HELI|nr:hypothetical protein [Helicobacter didelphidarum]RDU63607.1 hypothetical protein CQA53_08290 [Helicobacter didelphidarum]